MGWTEVQMDMTDYHMDIWDSLCACMHGAFRVSTAVECIKQYHPGRTDRGLYQAIEAVLKHCAAEGAAERRGHFWVVK